MRLTSSDIAKITDGTITGNPDLPVSDVITDSRRFSFTEELIFFAISLKLCYGYFKMEVFFFEFFVGCFWNHFDLFCVYPKD